MLCRMRLMLAGVLRGVVAFAVAVATLTSIVTLVGLLLIVTGEAQVSLAVGTIVIMWLATVTLLVAVARLAFIALTKIVDLGPPG